MGEWERTPGYCSLTGIFGNSDWIVATSLRRYVATDMDITTNGTMGFLLLKLDANVNYKDYQAPGHACSSE